MFNITFNLKKLLKKIFILIIIVIFIFILFKFSKKIFNGIFYLVNNQYSSIIGTEVSFSKYERVSFEKGAQKILSSELVTLGNIEVNNKVDKEEEDSQKVDKQKEKKSNDKDKNLDSKNEEADKDKQAVETSAEAVKDTIDYKNLKTEVLSDKNLKENYNAEYQGVKIKNESDYTLTEDILKPDIEYKNKKDILIFHTHTCESYTQTKENSYIESGNFRTTDLNYTVSRVGDELTKCLINKQFNVIHDTTYHDYPAYTGSYNRSLLTVKGILSKNPNIQTVIDLHRDAIGSKSEYGPAVKIGDERVAQVMFVIGTNGGGLEHPNWKNNLKYAVKIQQKANEMFPGLFRPIIVRNSRYNQNLADAACIIEVGATGNTLEECIGSMKYLAEVFEAVMK